MASRLVVTVAYCAPGVEDLLEVSLAEGATVADAIHAAQLFVRRPGLSGVVDIGVWGARCSPDQVLKDGDRVEIYRPLTIDPKEGRRERSEVRRKRRLSS